MGRLFGTDGVRGTYGQDLTDDIARGLGHAAAAVLGVPNLRLASEPSAVERLPSPLKERARHVVTETLACWPRSMPLPRSSGY